MRKIFFVIFTFFLTFGYSQSVFLKTGLNLTSYDYSNSSNSANENVKSSSGSFYEIGYSIPLKISKKYNSSSSKLNFETSLIINQFNATGGNSSDNYNWDTNYLGLKGNFIYSLIGPVGSLFNISLFTGIGLNKIIDGKQKIGGITYDIAKHNEFNKIMISPNVGLNIKYDTTKKVFLLLGVGMSKTLPLGKNSDNNESLSFKNTQVSFGVQLDLNCCSRD